MAVRIGQRLQTCSDFKFSVGDSLESPRFRPSTYTAEADTTPTGQFCRRTWLGGANWALDDGGRPDYASLSRR